MRGIEKSFLHDLYVKCYTEGGPSVEAVEHWAKSAGVDFTLFSVEYDLLVKKGYVELHQDDGLVHLTPKGTLYTEKSGYAPADLVRQNRDMRAKLLHTLATYLIKCAPNIQVCDLIDRAGLEGKYCLANIDLLVSLGYVRWLIPNVRLHINTTVCVKDEALIHSH